MAHVHINREHLSKVQPTCVSKRDVIVLLAALVEAPCHIHHHLQVYTRVGHTVWYRTGDRDKVEVT